MKTIAILGSTGSIGTQTLDVVRANGDIQVAALAAGSNRAPPPEQFSSSRSGNSIRGWQQLQMNQMQRL